MSMVSVRKINQDKISDIIYEEIERYNINFSRYDHIVIKPNLCCYRGCETGATTDPLLVESLIRIIKGDNENAKIAIVESDTWAVDADLAFTILGFRGIADRQDNVALINLSREKKTKVDLDGFYFQNFDVPETLLNPDFFITFPKLKTSVVDIITCALKNQYGCNPERRKEKYHTNLSKVIVDLNTLFKPDFGIVDGIIAQDVAGPAMGRPRRCDVLIFGNDVVSIDAEILKLTRLDKFKCKHLELAAKAGLGKKQGYERHGDIIGYNFLFSRWRHHMLRLNLFFGSLKK